MFSPSRVSHGDRWVTLWLVYDLLVHAVLEGSFIFYSLTGTVLTSEGYLAEIWKEYYHADKRWGVSDPTVVSLEILTVFFCTTLCFVLVYAIFTNKPYRHYLQIVLSVCELYGGWMTFAPEWLSGNQNLIGTEDLMRHILHLWFFNGMWVVIPVILLYQSWNASLKAFKDVAVKKGK